MLPENIASAECTTLGFLAMVTLETHLQIWQHLSGSSHGNLQTVFHFHLGRVLCGCTRVFYFAHGTVDLGKHNSPRKGGRGPTQKPGQALCLLLPGPSIHAVSSASSYLPRSLPGQPLFSTNLPFQVVCIYLCYYFIIYCVIIFFLDSDLWSSLQLNF